MAMATTQSVALHLLLLLILLATTAAAKASLAKSNPLKLKLAERATNSSFSHLLSALSYTSNLSKKMAGRNEALEDCVEMLGDAVDEVRDSVSKLGQLRNATGVEAARLVSDVQTYMSAALTNEYTCTDGLQEAGNVDQRIRKLFHRLSRAHNFITLALALVNHLLH